jgi:hypothetical protein
MKSRTVKSGGTLVALLLIAFAGVACKSKEPQSQSSSSQVSQDRAPASKNDSTPPANTPTQASPTVYVAPTLAAAVVYEPLKNRREIRLDIEVKATSITRSPVCDGNVQGKIATLTIAGRTLDLNQKEITHHDGKAWIATKNYGDIRIAGGYGFADGSKNDQLGSQITEMIPPNTMTVSYLMPGYPGVCVWLTPGQKGDLKKLAEQRHE